MKILETRNVNTLYGQNAEELVVGKQAVQRTSTVFCTLNGV
jgi:hypothetical protein